MLALIGVKRNPKADELPVLKPGSGKQPGYRIPEGNHEYNCVKNSFTRGGFVRVTGPNWLGQWSRPLSEDEFAAMNPYQKVRGVTDTSLTRARQRFRAACLHTQKAAVLPQLCVMGPCVLSVACPREHVLSL